MDRKRGVRGSSGRVVRWLAAGLCGIGCGATVVATRGVQWASAPRGPATVAPPAAAPSRASAGRGGPGDRAAGASFEALRVSYQDLTYPGLVDKLKLRRAPDGPPSFDPTSVDYWRKIRRELQLTSDEEAIYRRTGLVQVDHAHRYTMASGYLAIYTHDLPVLITSDSILHALHRSFDAILMELELEHFLPQIKTVLGGAHRALAAQAAASPPAALQASLRDVDLYLTVALDLLAGDKGTPATSVFGQDDGVRAVLDAVASLRPDERFVIYGTRRPIDWSQFKPRGHYAESPMLQRYFQAVMWLGRVDLGFGLAPASPLARGGVDLTRERRDAAALSLLLARSGQLETLAGIDRVIAFFVGDSDNAGPAAVAAALARAGVKELADLAPDAALDRMAAELSAAGVGGQRIRSQVVGSHVGDTAQTPLPDVFQTFGQRFVLDSFVLSKVVFDAIIFRSEKQTRFMPAGLDVMAALGNDEAVALLQPQLERDNYAANLLAARAFVEQQPAETWNASVYNIWLSALSKLDDVPAGTRFPEVMRGRAWQAKQLQTQMASWAELRHDTILYAKQSFTSMALCEYPIGYVEPYPELFARLAVFAEQSRGWLAAAGISTPRIADFLANFATVTRRLERLAGKELAAQSFDSDERTFIKDAISVQWHHGCAGPTKTYSGWYTTLIYGEPDAWKPTVADVHTDPNTGQVLEVGVGDANFVIVAVDNAGDRAAYVGPAYSYYEFGSPERLTDQEWEARIWQDKLPPRPDWTRAFVAPPLKRNVAPPPK